MAKLQDVKIEMYSEDVLKDFKKEEDQAKFLKGQQRIIDSINGGNDVSDEDLENYVLTDKDLEYYEGFKRMAEGKSNAGTLKEYLASPQAKILIPKIIVGAARRAAEPVYLASKFYKKVRAKNGILTISPVIGTMKAQELAEGQAPAIQALDINMIQQHQFVTATRKGIMLQISEDYLNESQWDLVKYLIEEAGYAMARLKEQYAAIEMISRGWPVFDNSLRAIHPELGTTGVDYDENYNDTMSIDDFLDLIIALMNNEHTPTNILMHPLIWPVFARNGLTGALTGPTDSSATIRMPNASFPIGPQAVQGRLPFGLTIDLSPHIPIDCDNKRFDMLAIDANNIGIQIVKQDMKTDQFNDPLIDMLNIKMVESYNYATFDEGRGIAVAKNISMDRSWPMMDRIKTFNH
jgi:hypothetical protein